MRNTFSLRKSHEFPSPADTQSRPGYRKANHASIGCRPALTASGTAAAFRQLPIHVTPLSYTTMSTVSDAGISGTAAKAPAVVTDDASHSASVWSHQADHKHKVLVPSTTQFTVQEPKDLHIVALLMVNFYILRYNS